MHVFFCFAVAVLLPFVLSAATLQFLCVLWGFLAFSCSVVAFVSCLLVVLAHAADS